MKMVLMCGGFYEQWETPKHLQVVNGERIVERTIRLLKKNGCKDIVITSNNEAFDGLGVERLEHENSYRYENGKLNGYWVDAFYPNFRKNQKVTFIFGDVYFSEDAIKQIVNYEGSGNVLFGSAGALRVDKVWGEPFAYVVNDMGEFYDGIKAVKKLQDEGKCNRVPIVWELYRVLNGIDVNEHRVLSETYKVIDDGTNDCDTREKLNALRTRFGRMGNVFTVYSLNAIGGGESFLYYLAKKYSANDITILYKNGDAKQVARLKKYARVEEYRGQKIICKRAFFNYNLAFIENINAEKYVQIIHADYKAMNLTPKEVGKKIEYVAVSKEAQKQFTEFTGKECSVCYNPVCVDAPRKLRLISATRTRNGKGTKRMEILAEALHKAGVKFKWECYTNEPQNLHSPYIECKPPTLDIADEIVGKDWFIQLSDNEAFGLSVAEANSLSVPVIMTPCPAFKEIGIQGITIDFDMKNIPIDKIIKGMKVKNFRLPEDGWDELLVSTYEPTDESTLTRIRVTRNYQDIELNNKPIEKGAERTVPLNRAMELVTRGVAEILEVGV